MAKKTQGYVTAYDIAFEMSNERPKKLIKTKFIVRKTMPTDIPTGIFDLWFFGFG